MTSVIGALDWLVYINYKCYDKAYTTTTDN